MEEFSDGGFACGLAADGLPVVVPRKSSVLEMLGGSSPTLDLGCVPPSMGACLLWRVAACAVLAGCEARQFPVVVAAVRAMLSEAFNCHGTGATTMGCTPLVVVSGGAQGPAGVNCGLGCLGSGTRANLCIGRCLKLVMHHVGGATLGGTECTTIGTPSKVGACVGERAEVLGAGGWAPLTAEPSATVMPLTGLSLAVDFETTDPEAVVKAIALQLTHACWGARFPLCSSAVVFVSPEHYRTLRPAYATREAFQRAVFDECDRQAIPHFGWVVAQKTGSALAGALAPAVLALGNALGKTPLSKFESPDAIRVVVCGGDQGSKRVRNSHL